MDCKSRQSATNGACPRPLPVGAPAAGLRRLVAGLQGHPSIECILSINHVGVLQKPL
jgi:hypothetical protein